MLRETMNRRPGFWCLLHQQQGSTSVEYAALFGVVAVSLGVGIYCLGQMSKASLNSTAVAIAGKTPADASPSFADGQRRSEHPGVSDPQSSDSVEIARWQILATGIALLVACGAPLFFILKRTHRKTKSTPGSHKKSQTESVPSHDEQAFAKRHQIRHAFEKNMASLLEGRLKVRHVMSRQLTCVRKSASVETVREMMESKQIQYVIVSSADGKLLGVISKHDCERKGKRAADIMTPEPFSLDADADISPAVTLLIRQRISCLPVTSDGHLSGIVTTNDVLVAFQCALHTLSSVVQHLRDLPHRKKSQSGPRKAIPSTADMSHGTSNEVLVAS